MKRHTTDVGAAEIKIALARKHDITRDYFLTEVKSVCYRLRTCLKMVTMKYGSQETSTTIRS